MQEIEQSFSRMDAIIYLQHASDKSISANGADDTMSDNPHSLMRQLSLWIVICGLIVPMIMVWWDNAILELAGILVSVLLGLLTTQTYANCMDKENDMIGHASDKSISANGADDTMSDNPHSLP